MKPSSIKIDITGTRTFKEALLELGQEYDKEYREYPGHEYEGAAVYLFFLQQKANEQYLSQMKEK